MLLFSSTALTWVTSIEKLPIEPSPIATHHGPIRG
jgi:hypothetical protein